MLKKLRMKNNYMQRMIDEAQGIAVKKINKDDNMIPFNEYQEALYLCMSVIGTFDND